MHDDDFRSREEKEIDLRLENQSLRDEISLRGGHSHSSGELDSAIENNFLKDVLAFEQGLDEPQVPLRSFFPPNYRFPPAASLSDEQIAQKLDEIQEILSLNHVEFGFGEEIPDRVLYRHIVEHYIPTESIPPINVGAWVLDGCGGWCEECFQKEYCSTAKDILEDEM